MIKIKRPETLKIERSLEYYIRQGNMFGCEEITIGFEDQGHGNEIVDYMAVDKRGIIRCWEIKVTKQDLKSSAKKSWYGNFNYLVVTDDLYNCDIEWQDYLYNNAGLIVAKKPQFGQYYTFEHVIRATQNDVPDDVKIMLLLSMIRSEHSKMLRYKNSGNITKLTELEVKLRKIKKDLEVETEKVLEYRGYIRDYKSKSGIDITDWRDTI